jgi:para-aminobenzoate synthetase/4-amino-4-deoxychorismate lyase
MPLHAALLRYPASGGRRWLRFSHPVATFEADQTGEVATALNAADAASRDGLWVVGMVSYDAAPAFDPALRALRDLDLPLVSFAAFDQAQPSRGPAGAAFSIGPWSASRDQNQFERDIHTVKAHIAAGETYQTNYTIRLDASFDGDPMAFFAALARAQRADHLAYLDFGDRAICSASPELFLRRHGNELITRPMKGTRPRHPDPAVDRQLADELISSDKDRAENTMIVDMARNDLGRLARIGSLRTTELHTVESYPTVHQLTSTVSGETSAGLMEIFSATFPGASITGAPKVRTAGLIVDLEQTPRGIYTGSIGAIEPGGDFEFNIAIRTAFVDRVAGRVRYGVGGGIVWDSDPTAEWQEAHDKARVLHRASQPFRLLETLAWEPGAGAILLDRHLDRLQTTATHFGFDLDREEVRRRLDGIRSEVGVLVRLLVDLDGRIELESHPLPSPAVRPTVVFDDRPIDASDEFLRHKTTRRERYDQARARFPEAFDVLLFNDTGELTESTIANLVAEIDGERLTPPVVAGLLPGTFRAELLANRRIRESAIRGADLRRASRVWLINSVRGWTEVSLDWSRVPDLVDSPLRVQSGPAEA